MLAASCAGSALALVCIRAWDGCHPLLEPFIVLFGAATFVALTAAILTIPLQRT